MTIRVLLPLFSLAAWIAQPAQAEEWVVGVWPCFASGRDPLESSPQPGTPLTGDVIEGSSNPTPDREITVYVNDSCDGTPPPPGQAACRVTDSSKGIVRTLWSSTKDRSYCLPRAESLVEELEAAGYYCMPVDAQNVCESEDWDDDLSYVPDPLKIDASNATMSRETPRRIGMQRLVRSLTVSADLAGAQFSGEETLP